jgi:hypothetical protein
MLITYGILEFSNTPTVYIEYESPIEQLVKFSTNVLPPFIMLTSDIYASASMVVEDSEGNEIESGLSIDVVTNINVDQLTYAGQTLTAKICGHYRLKLTHGTSTYYSEFFEWVDNASGLLEITATPTKILVNNCYVVDLTSLIFDMYLSTSKCFNGRAIKSGSEVNEEGISKNYGEELLKSTTNFQSDIEIIGNDSTFKFLAMLRVSCIGGSIILKYNNREKSIYATTVEQAENINFGEKIIIKFVFREEAFISNCAE